MSYKGNIITPTNAVDKFSNITDQDKWQSEFKLTSILHQHKTLFCVCYRKICFLICLIIKSNKHICLSHSLSSLLNVTMLINISPVRHCSLQTFFPKNVSSQSSCGCLFLCPLLKYFTSINLQFLLFIPPSLLEYHHPFPSLHQSPLF